MLLTIATIVVFTHKYQLAITTTRIAIAAPLGSAGKRIILAACKPHTAIVSTFSVSGQTTAECTDFHRGLTTKPSLCVLGLGLSSMLYERSLHGTAVS